ncbi:hypothetical protein [Desulfovibrio ferrophilus]|uniref:Uncharacterized protein n=1 Tax=Desulfovibrio ferrophilus TaxID=241368 RepID=A0A2Z6AZU8_9BACT|nr:hypothetical protein [Desulfovibrio ferrophilus]BBD08764.1 uncharacterized protein DFE_2038 [Desulfovibrio ferrophilus]
MDEALTFTQNYLDAIEAARIKQGRSHSDIARSAFPTQRDPVGTYRKVRNSGRTLKLPDAYRLAHAVHQDFSSLCWQVSQAMQGYSLKAPSPE